MKTLRTADLLSPINTDAVASALSTVSDVQGTPTNRTRSILWRGPYRSIELVEAHLSAALDAAESIAVTLSKQERATGNTVTLGTFTLNSALGAGIVTPTVTWADHTITPGDYLRIGQSYTAGGAPVAPVVTITVQGGG